MPALPAGTRLAGPADEDAIYALLIAMHRESALAQLFDYHPETVREMIRIGTRGEDGIIGLALAADGGVVGTCGLLRDRWWWTRNDEFLRQVWLFVRPDERTHGYEKQLFAFVEWVRATMEMNLRRRGNNKPVLVEGGFQAFDRIAARERLWCRHFGRKVSIGFLSGLTNRR